MIKDLNLTPQSLYALDDLDALVIKQTNDSKNINVYYNKIHSYLYIIHIDIFVIIKTYTIMANRSGDNFYN
jgi:hypothetical protein